MFGMGGSEIIVILIVALLFLGPDKLPEATKAISKGIRDIKRQSRVLQQSIEDDEHIGGAIRDIKSALRGDEIPPKPLKPLKKLELPKPVTDAPPVENSILGEAKPADAVAETSLPADAEPEPVKPAVTLSTVAGEADPDVVRDEDPAAADAELAAMIRPPTGTVAKGEAEKPSTEPDSSEQRKHG
jgi:sec-independent protein translocase protein TatB